MSRLQDFNRNWILVMKSKLRTILNKLGSRDENLLTMVYMCLKENRSLADGMAIMGKAERLEQKNIFKNFVH